MHIRVSVSRGERDRVFSHITLTRSDRKREEEKTGKGDKRREVWAWTAADPCAPQAVESLRVACIIRSAFETIDSVFLIIRPYRVPTLILEPAAGRQQLRIIIITSKEENKKNVEAELILTQAACYSQTQTHK